MSILLLQNLTSPTPPFSLTTSPSKPNHIYLIGRRSECDISLRHDSSISRHHARIRVAEVPNKRDSDDVTIEAWIFDQSTFGTEVNGSRLKYAQPHKLKHGDLIHFGTRDYLFQCQFVNEDGSIYQSRRGRRSKKKHTTFLKPTLSSLNKSKSSAEFHFEPSTSPANRDIMHHTLSPSHSRKPAVESPSLAATTSKRSEWLTSMDSPSSPMNQKKTRRYLEELAAPLQLGKSSVGELKRGRPSKAGTILRIIDSETTEEGNHFYTVELLDGSTDCMLKEILSMRGYDYLIEEFEGKARPHRYEEYYQSALRHFKKRIGYYQYKYSGFCIAVDSEGEVFLFDEDEDRLIQKLMQLRKVDPVYRKKYLAPFVVSMPQVGGL